jgi:hypothetical protein
MKNKIQLRGIQNNKDNVPEIRIQKKDFEYFEKNKLPKYLNHFNLQICGHETGKIYLLPKILKQGYFISKEKEKLPKLDYNESIVGLCIEVKENLKYEDLTKLDFKYSFPNIQNITSLKQEILYRYQQSLPNLSEEEILSLGISFTKLKILGKLKTK